MSAASAQVLARLAAEVHAVVARGDADPVGAAHRELAARAPLLPAPERRQVVERVAARVHGLGALEALLADPTVTEVLVNAGREVWVERAGRLERAPVELAPGEAEQLVERVLAPLGVRADRLSPVADARLPDGSRVHVVLPPVAADGASVAIRRFAPALIALEAFGPHDVVTLLAGIVADRRNIVVSGATSSGKTTLLNGLASCIDAHQRVVTIEDACELRLPGEHVVRLEARRPSTDGLGEVTIRELVRAALRMRPDRIVIGEVRGGEAFDMIQALNTGHDGSLATCHANGPLDALRRLETMVLLGAPTLPLAAAREQVHASIDVIVHVARGTDGARRVAAVAEVSDVDDVQAGGARLHALYDGRHVRSSPRRSSRSVGP